MSIHLYGYSLDFLFLPLAILDFSLTIILTIFNSLVYHLTVKELKFENNKYITALKMHLLVSFIATTTSILIILSMEKIINKILSNIGSEITFIIILLFLIVVLTLILIPILTYYFGTKFYNITKKESLEAMLGILITSIVLISVSFSGTLAALFP